MPDIKAIIGRITDIAIQEPYLAAAAGLLILLFFLRKFRFLRAILLIGAALLIAIYLIIQISSVGSTHKRAMIREHEKKVEEVWK
ncbi:MAG: hypothetical protein D6726_03170 [Nitrospirae bacterium]|nr:MAG: hypothetical protein D6726_03170 [Nitrospirota bacterium]